MDQSTRPCRVCGICKPENGYGDRPVRCTDCFNAWRRAKRHAAAPTLSCVNCGGDFKRIYGTTKLCSPECVTAWNRKRAGVPDLVPVGCLECKTTFLPKRSDGRYCSSRCIDRAKYSRNRKDPDYLAAKKAYWLSYREANAELIKAKATERRNANLEANRRYQREWSARHRYKVSGSWRSRNLDKAAAKQRVRNRRLAALTPFDISHAEVMAKVAYWGSKCWLCGGAFQAVDHVKPLAKDGLNILSNLRPICTSCNSRKRDRWFGVQNLDQLLPT
jgi:5-methylcytosine-specific restriction endonuclease McrA